MSAGTNIGRRMEVVAVLLDHEARTGRGLGVMAVAALLDREKSIVSRALASLADTGLVERDPETLEFTVGAGLLTVAARAGDPALLNRAVPELRRLATELGERAGLMVLQGDQVLTVDTAVADSSIQAVGWAGRTTPIHCTASGRVLVTGKTKAELSGLIGERGLFGGGPTSPRTMTDLWSRVEQAARDGYAVADGELDADVLAVAVPVHDAHGQILAALTITGPRFRMASHREAIVRHLIHSAGRCRPPAPEPALDATHD